MISDKDKKAIEESKKLINEQIKFTKKLDLGLDADRSTEANSSPKSRFYGFINGEDLSPLDAK